MRGNYKNALVCDCGNPKERGRGGCARCERIESSMYADRKRATSKRVKKEPALKSPADVNRALTKWLRENGIKTTSFRDSMPWAAR